jgi:hypothetical protein
MANNINVKKEKSEDDNLRDAEQVVVKLACLAPLKGAATTVNRRRGQRK